MAPRARAPLSGLTPRGRERARAQRLLGVHRRSRRGRERGLDGTPSHHWTPPLDPPRGLGGDKRELSEKERLVAMSSCLGGKLFGRETVWAGKKALASRKWGEGRAWGEGGGGGGGGGEKDRGGRNSDTREKHNGGFRCDKQWGEHEENTTTRREKTWGCRWGCRWGCKWGGRWGCRCVCRL